MCPSNAIWRHKSGSTLAQVMACCLTALRHYLNQCWLIINGVFDMHMEVTSQEVLRNSIRNMNEQITLFQSCTWIPQLQRRLGLTTFDVRVLVSNYIKPNTNDSNPCSNPCQSLLVKDGPGARFTNSFFARNSNSMETSPCCNPVADQQIATNFCTCHDSTAVVPYAKFCGDHCIRIEMRVKQNFHRIWIAMKKPLVKRAPGTLSFAPMLAYRW